MLSGTGRILSRCRGRQRDRGVVLLATMMMLLIIIVMLPAFVQQVQTDAIIADNRRQDVATAWAARAGIALGMARLSLDEETGFDSLNEPWADEISDRTLGETTLNVRIADESSKFNLLALIVEGNDEEAEATREWAREALAYLIQQARAEDEFRLQSSDMRASEIVENIVTWLEDTDSSGRQEAGLSEGPTLGGAPDEGRRGPDINKTHPFPILTVSELLLIEGVTRSLLYGPPKRLLTAEASRRDDEEQAFGGGSGRRIGGPLSPSEQERQRDAQQRPLLDFVTIFGNAPARINVNTAPREVLMALDSGITDEIADAIMDARESVASGAGGVGGIGGGAGGAGGAGEEEDQMSLRAADIASREAFSEKIEIENITEELWEAIGGRLRITSNFFTIIATAKGGEDDGGPMRAVDLEQSWRALVYRMAPAGGGGAGSGGGAGGGSGETGPTELAPVFLLMVDKESAG